MITLAFIGALVVVAIIACILTEVERYGWATLMLIATAAATQFFHVLDLLGWVRSHTVEFIIYTSVYVVVGVIWSFIKWFSFLMSFRDRFRQQKRAFLATKGTINSESVSSEQMVEFKQWMDVNYVDYDLRSMERPKASKNKSRITGWMAFWPLSLIGTLINDPIRRLFDWMFKSFRAAYEKMADAVLRQDAELK